MVFGFDLYSFKLDLLCNIYVVNMIFFKLEYYIYSGRVFLIENKVFGNVIKYSILCLRCFFN